MRSNYTEWKKWNGSYLPQTKAIKMKAKDRQQTKMAVGVYFQQAWILQTKSNLIEFPRAKKIVWLIFFSQNRNDVNVVSEMGIYAIQSVK